ncbi:MAG: hypothetical protein L6W00_13930 [Lentisphaeria bacterium]|nr:MAG: hypothetical protein L6W00_13930 [Lentisphaeria bacterium]
MAPRSHGRRAAVLPALLLSLCTGCTTYVTQMPEPANSPPPPPRRRRLPHNSRQPPRRRRPRRSNITGWRIFFRRPQKHAGDPDD